MRLWRDDTGDYQIHGRLVKIMAGKVRILKDTGRYTTVPTDRLSASDLEYVQQRAKSAGTDLAVNTAQN